MKNKICYQKKERENELRKKNKRSIYSTYCMKVESEIQKG